MKKNRKKIIAFLFLIVMCVLLTACGNSGPRGDGKTTCKNCGRKGVVLFGYCESCADSFLEWQRKNGY